MGAGFNSRRTGRVLILERSFTCALSSQKTIGSLGLGKLLRVWLPHTYHFTKDIVMLYTLFFSEKEENGLEILKCTRRTDRVSGLFYVRLPLLRLLWAALVGAFGLPVALYAGFSTCFCCPPCLRTGCAVLTVQGINNAKHHHVYTLSCTIHQVPC